MSGGMEVGGSAGRELVRSPGIELMAVPKTGLAQVNILVTAPGWGPFTHPNPGWPWGGGVSVGELTFTTITWFAQANSLTKTVVMNLDRYNQYPLAETLTDGVEITNPGNDLLTINALFGYLAGSAGSGTYTVSATSKTYSQPGFGTASVTLSDPYTLSSLYASAHRLLNQFDLRAIEAGQQLDATYAPGPSVAFPQEIGGFITVPTLFQVDSGIYMWGWGSPASANANPPPYDPRPTPFKHVAPLPPYVLTQNNQVLEEFRNIAARSAYSFATWQMAKGVWRKTGQTQVGIRQEFTADNPGPPSQTTPVDFVWSLDPDDDLILDPTGTEIDIPADTNNNNYSGFRYPNFMP